jgi:crotonobetainyl-CoA:carnitine CoA-transferase CaiB-like acyl-CoA transferase
MPPPHAGQHTVEVLADWGFGETDVAKLVETGAIR